MEKTWFKLIAIDFLPWVIWPIGIFLLIFYFRKELKDFSRRLIKLGPGGAEAAAPQQTATPNYQNLLDQEIIINDPILQPWEKPIRDHILEFKNSGKYGDTDLMNILIRDLANSRQRVAFETISRQIFGTQISLLRHLLSGDENTRENLTDIFNEHKKRTEEFGHSSFDVWIGYMLQFDLVAMKAGKYQITEMGKLYLTFADQIGVNENRLF